MNPWRVFTKNMFDLITSTLPTEYKGVNVKTDFKQALKFFKILDSEELDQKTKALLIMRCLFCLNPFCCDTPIDRDPDLWEFINYYISGGSDSEKSGGTKSYDFVQDADYIYSAFMQIYGINLRQIKMHWWEFLALFKSLPEGTMLSKIIDIRTKDIDPKMDSKNKANLMRLKSQFMLKNMNQTFKPMI